MMDERPFPKVEACERLEPVMEETLRELALKSFEELLGFPEMQTLWLPAQKGKAQAVLYKEHLEADALRLVLVTLEVGGCCTAGVNAVGILVEREGKARKLTLEELEEFAM